MLFIKNIADIFIKYIKYSEDDITLIVEDIIPYTAFSFQFRSNKLEIAFKYSVNSDDELFKSDYIYSISVKKDNIELENVYKTILTILQDFEETEDEFLQLFTVEYLILFAYKTLSEVNDFKENEFRYEMLKGSASYILHMFNLKKNLFLRGDVV